MKEYLIELVRDSPSMLMARNTVREYLQARILLAIQRAGGMIPLAFHGGTALRFLYNTARYSEDLDFTLENPRLYDIHAYLRKIRREFTAENYEVEIKLSDKRIVHSALIRFQGLLYEVGLSSHRDEIIAVKIEVDTNPPNGSILATTIIHRYVTLQIQHHDRATLFAGKLHAILQRPFIKGRDIYDLLWYLSNPNFSQPNLIMLNNALQQTGWEGKSITKENWRNILYQRLQNIPWNQAVDDVRPFLNANGNPELLTRENLLRLLE